MFGFMETIISVGPIVDLIARAAAEVGCINIRALIKARPLIEMMALSAAVGDASRAESFRAEAFAEAADFAFQCAS